MNNQLVISTIRKRQDSINVLFKPGQKKIIEKMENGIELNENEKRYLRGTLGRKLDEIALLMSSNANDGQKQLPFLSALGQDYYITGFEALKHNGYGWYYEPRTIHIINTRLKGSIEHLGKRIIFVRVKSLKGSSFWKDPGTRLRYATNEQILKDARHLKDNALERAWWSMFRRYPEIFVENAMDYEDPDEPGADIEDFGV